MELDHPLLERLVDAPGVPGDEGDVTRIVADAVPAALQPRRDDLGNLLIECGSASPRLLISVHTDEPGLLITKVWPDGSASFLNLGALDRHAYPGQQLRVRGRHGTVYAVIGTQPPHLASGTPPLDLEELRIDFGTQSRDETAALGIEPLCTATFDRRLTRLAGGMLCSRGLDDRATCYALIEVVKRSRPQATLLAHWSTQNEVGLRGVRATAARRDVDLMIAVAATSTIDAPHAPEVGPQLRLGGGPVLRLVDPGALGDPSLEAWVCSLAASAGIALQRGHSTGENEGKPFQRRGVPTLALALPVRYLHSNVEVLHRSDLAELIELLILIVDRAHRWPGKDA